MKTRPSLNLLLISKTLPWQFKGGIQTHTWELAKSLKNLGHDITILNGGPFFSKCKTTLMEDIKIVQVPFFPGRYLKPMSTLAEELAFNLAAFRWVNKNHSRFNIIHAQGRSGNLLGFLPKVRKKLVNTVHGLIDSEDPKEGRFCINHFLHKKWTLMIEKKLFNQANQLITVSTDLQKSVQVTRHIARHIDVVTNGVGIHERIKEGSQKHHAKFIFIGRLHPVKGIAELVKQMEYSLPEVSLDIIGGGAEKEKIQGIIAEKKLEHKVRLLGEYSNDKIHEIMGEYTALVLPSLYETQGIVLLEAHVHALPVIASDLLAIRETVTHQVNGMLCKKNDFESFIRAMNELSEDPYKAAQMGAMGYKNVVANYSWDHIAQRTEQLYYGMAS